MRIPIVTLTLLLGTAHAQAQTARVQVIHNSADAAAATVDVYVGNTLLLDNFAFRTASPFIDAPAGVSFTVGIAPPNSTGADQAIFTQNFTLADGGTYVVVADGIVSPTGYSPAVPFSLEVYDMGREAAAGGSMMTDVLVHHGSTDAPTVDIYESALANTTIVNDAPYGAFAGYLELGTADYTLQVRDQYNSTIVAAYSAPLASLNLGGTALVALASGFLDPSVNSGGPAFGLYVALPSGGPLVALPAAQIPTARVQVIHNSADLAAAQVDVWLNNTPLIDNFAFRSASPFVDAQAGVPFDVSIALPTSTDTIGALAKYTFTLGEGETYIIVADGIVSPTGYSPAVPFSLEVYATGREVAAGGSMMTDVLVHHGSTDAPTVDIYESALANTTIVNDISYGEFAGYLELGTADYTLQVRDQNNSTIVAAYSAPLASLNLGGTALVTLASGFLNPSVNSGGAAFGLYVALPSGGPLVPLPAAEIPTARVQVIHNSADLAAAQVDVWLNNTLLLDNFTFRTASPFVDAQAGVPFDVSIALPTSTDTTGALAHFTYNLAEGGTYILIANGIVSASGYSPATPFNLYVEGAARETSTVAGNVDVLVFHGSTDAPIVDVVETSVPAGTIVSGLSYGEFAGYLELAEADYSLLIETMGTPVVSYDAPLAALGLAGNAITVLASGFLDPSVNSDGAAFGLWVALPTGGALVELPLSTGLNEKEIVASLTTYPNPATNEIVLAMDLLSKGKSTLYIQDALGRQLDVKDLGTLSSGQQRIRVDLSGLSAGAYWLRFQNGAGQVIVPVQKQ